MDDDIADLIRTLCTRSGMIMEDASATAILVGGLTGDQLSRAVKHVQREIAHANAIIAAAAALTGMAE